MELTKLGAAKAQPVKSRRLFEEVCTQIRAHIADGTLKAGDKLPSERDLAIQFGIGRSAIREALRSLEFAGLIVLRKGAKGGSFLLHNELGLFRPFQALFETGGLTLEELTAARIEIQDIVVRMAVENATESDFKALDRDVKRNRRLFAKGSDITDVSSSMEFYGILAAAAGNRVLSLIVHALSQMVHQAIPDTAAAPDFDFLTMREQFIVRLRERDAAGATEIMRNSLCELHDYILAEKRD